MNQKTWGPFSGTQLTIIIVAALAATVPGALFAIEAVSTTAITDPITNKKAEVDGQRRLRVYDAIGVYERSPANYVRFAGGVAGSTCPTLVAPAAGKALVIKTLAFNVYQLPATGSGKWVAFYVGAPNNCSSNAVYRHNASAFGIAPVNFEPGIVVPAGQVLSVNAIGDVQAEAYGSGYSIPAAQAPASQKDEATAMMSVPPQQR